jgi:H+/Cl- antiporter ClcA
MRTQYSALGVGCAAAAVMLYEGVRVSEVVLRPLPRWASAPLGGALCGIIAIRFPQVQYGYINLEEIFRDSTHLSVGDLSGLLLAKIAATSVCVGGGLVGGLFAPSLFLGALVGDIMGHFVANNWGVADPTTLTVVGAAAVLGAACRAPLTAFALMVEITRWVVRVVMDTAPGCDQCCILNGKVPWYPCAAGCAGHVSPNE